jgi:hypothetical protein
MSLMWNMDISGFGAIKMGNIQTESRALCDLSYLCVRYSEIYSK